MTLESGLTVCPLPHSTFLASGTFMPNLASRALYVSIYGPVSTLSFNLITELSEEVLLVSLPADAGPVGPCCGTWRCLACPVPPGMLNITFLYCHFVL